MRSTVVQSENADIIKRGTEVHIEAERLLKDPLILEKLTKAIERERAEIIRWKFHYGDWPNMTVTVDATSLEQAERRARDELDRRYEKLGKEPPVSWTLRLAKKRSIEEMTTEQAETHFRVEAMFDDPEDRELLTRTIAQRLRREHVEWSNVRCADRAAIEYQKGARE